MRDIKFRAWDGKIMHDHESVVVYLGSGWLENESFDCDSIHIKSKVDHLMQFTGLTDKSGVDIYESDVICQGGVNVPVIWNNKWGCWELEFSIHPIEGGELQNLDFSDLCDRAEVVGNIYMNPELLKTNKIEE